MIEDVACTMIMPEVFTNRTVTYVYVAPLLKRAPCQDIVYGG
jgi:hypothetical protein